MTPRLLVIGSILFALSGCASNESAEPPESQLPPEVVQKKAPSEQEQATRLNAARVEQLNEMIRQQEAELKKLREEQVQNRLVVQNLEEKLLTNFELMEHSVAGALSDMKTKMETPSLKTPNSTQGQNAASSKSRPAPSAKTTSPQTSVSQNSQQAIEDYSLFQKKPAASNEEKAAPAFKESNPKPLVPIPLPLQEENMDERPAPAPSKVQPARTQLLNLSPNEEKETFTDPNLKEPQNPYQLKSRPEIKKLYDQGMDAMINREYPDAIASFQSMLKQFPDDEYSDNALFWLGHIHFTRGRFDEAEAAFQKVLSQYEHRPTSQGYKTPDAIYMLGKTSQARKDKERATYYFQEVIRRFPGSTAATNAGESLKKLP